MKIVYQDEWFINSPCSFKVRQTLALRCSPALSSAGVTLHTHRHTAALKTANITGSFFFCYSTRRSGWVGGDVRVDGGVVERRENEEESEQWGRAEGVEMREGGREG